MIGAAFIILALAGTVAAMVYETQKTIYRESSGHLVEIAHQLSERFSDQCETNWNVLDTFIRDYYLIYGSGTKEELVSFLSDYQQTWGYSHLFFIDKSGSFIYETGKISKLQFDNSQSIYRVISKRENVVAPATDYDGTEILLFARPVEPFELDGHLIEGAGICYEVQSMLENMNINAFKESCDVYLLDADGITVARSIHEDSMDAYNIVNAVEKENPELENLEEQLLSGKNDGIMQIKAKGRDAYLSYTTVDVVGWKQLLMVPVDVVNNEMHNYTRMTGMLVAVLILLAAAGIGGIVHFFYRINAEKKQKEIELEYEHKANESKSRFLANMSHDIRTPMNGVLGMATLAAANIDDRQKALEYIDKIQISGKYLVSLINDILDVSKISEGAFEIAEKPMNISEFIEDIRFVIGPLADNKKQHFTIEKDIRNEYVFGDKLHLNQIGINILSNAVKFTPEGEEIRLSIVETPGASGEYAHYHMEFRDNGIGMKKEFIEHIFESFTREKDSTIDSIEGSGLGMFIVKNLVELMHGTIKVESEPGKGSCFIVDLELKLDPNGIKADKEEPEDSTEAICGRKILLAEDNIMNREIAVEMLQEMGAFVITAENGQEAVEKFAESPTEYFDVILMDVMMPVMGGYEASRRIRRLERADAESVPIIAITANAFQEDIIESEEAGMNAHLSKPLDFVALGRQIELLTRHKRKLQREKGKRT